MTTVRVLPLSEAASQWPAFPLAAATPGPDGPSLSDDAVAVWIDGDVELPALHLHAPLAAGTALHAMLAGAHQPQPLPVSPALLVIGGDLALDGALTADDAAGGTHLLVRGRSHVGHALIAAMHLRVEGALVVRDLLWGHGAACTLQADGGLQARVALCTGGFTPRADAPQAVDYWLDADPGRPSLIEFTHEALAVVLQPQLLPGLSVELLDHLDRRRAVTDARAGAPLTRSTAEIESILPRAQDRFTDETITVPQIRAVLRSAVIPPKEFLAAGWFGQTDFSLCRWHVDDAGDARDDSVFITVWKTWDFYLAAARVPRHTGPRGLAERLWAAVRGQQAPTITEAVLQYRRYTDGEAGPWLPLDAEAAPDAWHAGTRAWRGVLEYARRAAGQARAQHPLWQRLQQTLTPERVEALTTLPVFTDQYNDWWDPERNGFWEDDVWIGARQPCMHHGEPWGRILKLSWANGSDGPGDPPDDAHACYQLDVDEAREGPPAVLPSYAQRQSDSRAPVPPIAADHLHRLLRLFEQAQLQLGAASGAADRSRPADPAGASRATGTPAGHAR